MTAPTIPAHAFPARGARELQALARAGLQEAADQPTPGRRYAAAHLAALRAAAAVIAARATAGRRRGPVPALWELLPLAAPELREWAAYFAAGRTRRAAAEAGIPAPVTAREADELLQAATTFVHAADICLGAVEG